MLAATILFSILTIVQNQPSTLHMFAAIQTTYQTYLSYLPYFSTCNYNQSQFIPGSAQITQISETTFYESLLREDSVYFWTPVYQGFDIGYIIDFSNSTNFQGYILYDSKIQNLNRRVIFFNLNQSQLIFTSTFLIANVTNNSVLAKDMVTVPIQLPSEAEAIITNCGIPTKTNFCYIGGGQFLYVCGPSQSGFIFTPGQNQSTVQIVDFGPHVNPGLYQLASNPLLLNWKADKNPIQWVSLLLLTESNNQTGLYFLKYTNNTLTPTLVLDFYNQLQLIINRIWGQQVKQQVSRWMNIYKFLNINADFFFPGQVVSVFISIYDVIYVESVTENSTYLCIFDDQGNIFSNVTIQGSVVSYGSEATFVYNQEKLYKIQFQRPIFMINTSYFGNETIPNQYSYLNIEIQCTYVNITVYYQILWTSYNYPSGYIYSMDNNQIYSTDSVISFQTNQRFLVIGPAFSIIPELTDSVQVEVFDSSSIQIEGKAISIANLEVSSQGSLGVIVVTTNAIWQVNFKGQSSLLIQEPCGFVNITKASPIGFDVYQLIDNNGQQCQCNLYFQQCTLIQNAQQSQSQTDSIPSNENQFILPNLLLDQETPPDPFQTFVKKNLFGLINYGYIIVISQNNDIVLINATSRMKLDTVRVPCDKHNSTNGVLFKQEFYIPSMFVYCQEKGFIYQVIIYNNTFYQTRQIPIYNFITTSSYFGMKTTTSYIFLEVDPAQNQTIYPSVQNCCVLKLDPYAFTASFISQVILADKIVDALTFDGYEVALFTSQLQSLSNSKSILNIYLPSQWISFNYTQPSTVILQQQSIDLNFLSPYYNFAAIFAVNVTFNLTAANLTLIPDHKKKQFSITLEVLESRSGFDPIYGALVIYNMSQYVCGPVFTSFFLKQNDKSFNFVKLSQTQVLTKTKLIGNFSIDFLQIINPQNWNQYSTFSLNNLMLFISVDAMYVYIKILDNVQMVHIATQPLPQSSCTYNLLNIINDTAVNLSSNCFGINLNLKSPLLTINYNPNNHNFTMTYTEVANPYNLRDVGTIPVNSEITYTVGILVGPMNTQTGRLVMCLGFNCSNLHVSTLFSFLVNYATFNSDQTQSYFIFSIDLFTIGVYINPVIQPNKTDQIYPDYKFYYESFIGESMCSAMKVLNATQTFAQIILSCYSYYYNIYMNFSTTKMIINQKFSRYSQCALLDDFQPEGIFHDNKFQGFFAQCREDDNSQNTNAYNTIKSSFNTKYTGYLQIFIADGPLGPDCSKDSTSPIKIIPISTSMNRPLFKTYHLNSTLKFIYSDINGILIDNFVDTSPTLNIIFSPVTLTFTPPQIEFFVINQFYTKTEIIQTKQNPVYYLHPIKFFVFSVYLFLNLVTFAFILCYYSRKKNTNLSYAQEEQSEYDGKQKNDELLYEEDSYSKQSSKKQKQKSDRKSQLRSQRQSSRFSKMTEIQMFFMRQNNAIN